MADPVVLLLQIKTESINEWPGLTVILFLCMFHEAVSALLIVRVP